MEQKFKYFVFLLNYYFVIKTKIYFLKRYSMQMDNNYRKLVILYFY